MCMNMLRQQNKQNAQVAHTVQTNIVCKIRPKTRPKIILSRVHWSSRSALWGCSSDSTRRAGKSTDQTDSGRWRSLWAKLETGSWSVQCYGGGWRSLVPGAERTDFFMTLHVPLEYLTSWSRIVQWNECQRRTWYISCHKSDYVTCRIKQIKIRRK